MTTVGYYYLGKFEVERMSESTPSVDELSSAAMSPAGQMEATVFCSQ